MNQPVERVPTVHSTRRDRQFLAGSLPWLALGLPTASCLALAARSEQPLRTVWALLAVGCGTLLLLWASLRPTGIHARAAAGEE